MADHAIPPSPDSQTARKETVPAGLMAALQCACALFLAFAVVCMTARAQETGASSAALRAQIQAESASLTVRADFLGRLLFERYSDSAPTNSEAGRAALEAFAAAVRDRCDASYRIVLIPGRDIPIPSQFVPLEDRDDVLAYVIGEVSDKRQVMLGRHYRVDLSPDGKVVRSVVPSTSDCTIMSLSALTGSPYIRHQLSNGPTEFHVFLSLLHKVKFRVRAAIGIYEIDGDEVRLAEPDRAYRPERTALTDCKLPNGTTFRTTEAACRKAGGAVLE